ncbi:MAG: hypothetical protein AB1813_23340 [Verrucomicrobiota bacterium]
MSRAAPAEAAPHLQARRFYRDLLFRKTSPQTLSLDRPKRFANAAAPPSDGQLKQSIADRLQLGCNSA